jgi:hypothetical protein
MPQKWAESNMSTRFEILKNGERVCVSGINGDGVLSVGLSYVKHADQEGAYDLHIGGLGMFDGSQDRQAHAAWPAPRVSPGDEITIRVLPPGEFDEPFGMTASPRKTLNDPDFGQMSYYIDSWDADIAFDSYPLKSAHLHLRAGESGPSQVQRDLIRDLRVRHAQLWPELCRALVRCHPEIDTSEELTSRLVPHVGIDLDDASDTIRISYSVEGDPEFRGYFVTLRNWEIAEVCMAE